MAKKRFPKKVSNTVVDTPKLTTIQLEVLYLLTKEYLTPKQIAIRRQRSRQATNKTIRILKEKGIINQQLKKVSKNQPTRFPKPQKIRLHGEEFNIKILFKDKKYKELSKKANIIDFDGNTVRLYRDSIEVYSGKSFYGDTPTKADLLGNEYWSKLFYKLEYHLKIIFMKTKYFNIKRVNAHYSEINNELSEEMYKKGDKLRIYDNIDGKLWFTIDNSFNLHEAETQHPSTAKEDMQDTIQPFFNDLRDKNPPKTSEIWAILSTLVKHDEEIAAGLNIITTLIKSQIPKPEESKDKKIPDYMG